ncbi:hypothetical protein A3C96_00880 [Candidatus Uhrbacteria bacterium RIFCSPHIGHO2_02_FULL_60_10]|uniref:Uncharacterized protein n=1 Tax=Candidatus Uhrbacteria bacterium RIFCSPHIGHO2_02_FULL_60_10 TaxID=1802392 RepID=A0A1F7U9F6_9BACT|nr:MAG: hypothetical protein A3C96_00880 [Candidatus Uhrbacteria bacterium RIFCSPHIGHO2_02_FULL_60_10]
MSKEKISQDIQETLEMSDQQIEANKLDAAKKEIKAMTVTRIKGGIKEVMPDLMGAIKNSKEKPLTSADLAGFAEKAATKAGLTPAESVRMSEMLAKAMIFEARERKDLSEQDKQAIRELAEATLLPDELVQTSAEQLFNTMSTTDKELWPAFVDAHVDSLSRERLVDKKAVEKKLKGALGKKVKSTQLDQTEIKKLGKANGE